MTSTVDQSLPTWPAGVSLLLGLGAQKAGTTWLHDRLKAHPDCHAFPIKELHYFNTVSGLSRLGFTLTAAGRNALLRKGDKAAADRVSQLADLFHAQPQTHQDYVDLVTEGLEPGSVALDITPAYALLDDAQFEQVAAMDPVRFLYIMREPVARFWSNIRMILNAPGKDQPDFEPDAQALLDHTLDHRDAPMSAAAFARSDYLQALEKLERHVPAQRRLVLFFEDLFTEHTMNRIWAFLDVSPRPLTATEPRLEGVQASMRPDQIERLKDVFWPQYDAICARFGDAVPDAWHARFAPEVMAA
ncbi:sulfotransferase [Pararhodobacter sp.]|uniref:sulfotransferase n=1 Tax=Pararhodobacter sp. TaxID=2127056 RepID=UPI002AFE629D|nr:sulfotransferase [Pararhodobacter sp.]